MGLSHGSAALRARSGRRPRLLAWVLCGLLLCVAGWAFGAGPASAFSGINAWSDSLSSTQAGGHPDVNLHLQFDNHYLQNLENVPAPPGTCDCDDARIVDNVFPAGFIGNPHAIPACTLFELGLGHCPIDSQVGDIDFGLGYVAMYNMQPHPDEAGLVAFIQPLVQVPGFIILHARTGSDYGLDATSSPIFHLLPINTLDIHLWGVPADPSHDTARLPSPYPDAFGCFNTYPLGCYPPIASTSPPEPYLQNPTTCGVPLTAGVDLAYYDGSAYHADAPWPSTTGCDQLSFNPSLAAQPTARQTDSPSGFDADLKVPQPLSPTVPSPSEIKSTTVTLPNGFSINPNAADGKTVCTDVQGSFGTEDPANCPETSKVGTVQVDSSALPGPIDGAVYLGEPKPGNRYRIFLVADGFATHVKLAGSAHLDSQTGQVVLSFDDLPQSPLQEFNIHFFGSERGLLATPEQCGTYTVSTHFVPWDGALPDQTSTNSFTIDSGPNGSPCPGPSRDFNPTFSAGSLNNTAGAHTALSLKITRIDGDQNLTRVDVRTPPGFSATLKGVSYCPESALSRLAQPDYSGADELAAPSCPATSRIGTVTAGAGAGSHPLYTPGKAYLGGPYKGAPLSLITVVPAVSGPYDLGNVVNRVALNVDPTTAQVTAVSDPLPQILDGIPLRLRSVLIDLDRQNFALNPTNCDPFSIGATITGDEGAGVSPSMHFQVANCADLPFGPKLALTLSGGIKRNGNPALKATLTAKSGEANIASTVVTMPHSIFLDNAHINAPCTRVQYAANACPPTSILGTARATSPLLDKPLEGPVYLRSSSHKLPDLVAALRGQIDIELDGRIRFRQPNVSAPASNQCPTSR